MSTVRILLSCCHRQAVRGVPQQVPRAGDSDRAACACTRVHFNALSPTAVTGRLLDNRWKACTAADACF
eukprot:3907080-Alexandrium_andersonii.AAC.1